MRDRLGLAEHRDRVGRDQALHGDRAHIDQFEIVAAGHDQLAPVEEAVAGVGALLDRAVGQQRREHRRAVGVEPEQASSRAPPRRSSAASGKNGCGRRRAEDRHVAGDQHEARVGRARRAATKRRVVAARRDAVERRAGEAEAEARAAVSKKASFMVQPSHRGRRWPSAAAGLNRRRIGRSDSLRKQARWAPP